MEVVWMVVRIVLGAAWALIVGLAGGWLMLSPWALGQQPPAKDWTSVTQTDFFTGLGLVVLAILGFGLVASQAISLLRESGVLGRSQTRASGREARRAADGASSPDSAELETILAGLAQALTRELGSAPASTPSARPAHADSEASGEDARSEFPPTLRRLEG
jgi:hypothetical protein